LTNTFTSLFRSSLTYGHKSWVVTEKVLSEGQAAGCFFCEKSTTWHFATKCAAVKFVKPWMLNHFSTE